MLGEAVARGRHAETSPGDQPEADPAAEKKKKKKRIAPVLFFFGWKFHLKASFLYWEEVELPMMWSLHPLWLAKASKVHRAPVWARGAFPVSLLVIMGAETAVLPLKSAW